MKRPTQWPDHLTMTVPGTGATYVVAGATTVGTVATVAGGTPTVVLHPASTAAATAADAMAKREEVRMAISLLVEHMAEPVGAPRAYHSMPVLGGRRAADAAHRRRNLLVRL